MMSPVDPCRGNVYAGEMAAAHEEIELAHVLGIVRVGRASEFSPRGAWSRPCGCPIPGAVFPESSSRS